MKYLKYFACFLLISSLVSCSLPIDLKGEDKNNVRTEQDSNIIGKNTEGDVSRHTSEPSDKNSSGETGKQPESPDLPSSSADDSYTSKGYKITSIDGVTYVNGILIANKTYALPEEYAPGGLTSECEQAFYKMQSAAQADGLRLFVKSGYRSYIDQKIIYQGYVQSDSKENADRYSARPGHSEHQSGLALDINSTSSSFADTAEGKWLAQNCHKYGFILRYPKEKESITGYMYEPWHVRYVGAETAAAVYESGLCLEEYLGITSYYS